MNKPLLKVVQNTVSNVLKLPPRPLGDSPDPLDIEVGGRIRICRKQLNLSQTALADALGLTFQQVQKYERGANRVSASMLIRIAAKLETTVAALVGETEPANAPRHLLSDLAKPGADELVQLYGRINSSEVRACVLGVVRAIAVRPGNAGD